MIGLMSFADDDGRFPASQSAICGYVFPFDNISSSKFNKWLSETQENIIHLYEVDGLLYGCIPSWHNHQKINRYTPSTLPEPDVRCAPRGSSKGDDR